MAGSGFNPGSEVQLYVTSPGLGANGEQNVGRSIADSTGRVTQTLRIPLAATGFTAVGSKAGLVCLDALGAGSRAAHLDGFVPPVANSPQINTVTPGQAIPVTFTLPGTTKAALSDELTTCYAQSSAVDCASPAGAHSGESTSGSAAGPGGEQYNYLWKTDPSWRGCRELIVGPVDRSYDRVLFDFGR